eukprot:437998-Lingulodinium_polyedra.AAC.1
MRLVNDRHPFITLYIRLVGGWLALVGVHCAPGYQVDGVRATRGSFVALTHNARSVGLAHDCLQHVGQHIRRGLTVRLR